MMRLVYEVSGLEVREGDEVLVRDGNTVMVCYIVTPHKPGSTGRVGVVRRPLPNEVQGHQMTMEYFPSVIGAVWVEREDHGWTPLTVTEPVRVKETAMEGRPDLEHYRGKVGRARWAGHGYLGHVMVNWPELSCSSVWSQNDLENVG
jgi:hypothetical protein